MADVTTPPYDVISPEARDDYYARHPNNVIRLVLSKGEPGDDEKQNRYTRAAGCFYEWLEQGILGQDSEPALYLTAIDFVSEEGPKTRLGLMALVKIEDFGKGGILPHEKTFSATKADRLRLLRACKANFCPIFSLFTDPGGEVLGGLQDWTRRFAPEVDFADEGGHRHRLWRITDRAVCRQVGGQLAPKTLFIADGHHRYETALNYRNEMMAQKAGHDGDAPWGYVLMSLTSMYDPGLTIRPVHRLFSHVSKEIVDGFAEKAQAYFQVERVDSGGADGPEVVRRFLAEVRSGTEAGVMGAVFQEGRTLFVLRTRDGVMDRLFEGEIAKLLRRLDVTIATKLVVERILGLSERDLDDEKRIVYTSRTDQAMDGVFSGAYDMALIMNPTKLSDVEDISRAGLIMPRKSTYFFPKVLSGLVMNKIEGL